MSLTRTILRAAGSRRHRSPGTGVLALVHRRVECSSAPPPGPQTLVPDAGNARRQARSHPLAQARLALDAQ